MEGCLGGLDCSETSLKRDFPVILAALRKPAESSYRSGDFSSHLCFIPQYWSTMSETFSPRSSSVGERACSSERLCDENVLPEVAHDEEPFSSARKHQILKTTHEVAEEHGAKRSLQTTAAHEQVTKASFNKSTTPPGAATGTDFLEVLEKQTIEKGGGGGNEVVQPSSDVALKPLGSITVTNQNKTNTNEDTAPYSHDGNREERLDDYIPCLFYRWPLSDTLILHFHGMDEDLGKTAAYLQRLHQHLKVNVLAMEYPGYGICSELPRDSVEGSNESLCDSRTTRSRSHSFSYSSNYSGPSTSIAHQPAALSRRHPHQTNTYSPERAREQQAEEPEICVRSAYCGRSNSNFREKPPFVRKNSRLVNAGQASKESSKHTSSSQAAHHRQIAASFKRLLLFVLKRLEVPPQCIFLSAVKLAAGLVIELCQFADQANLSLGGLVLLQPLFIFPFSPPRISGLAPVESRGHITSPTEPVCRSEARNAGEAHRLSFPSKRTQNGVKNVLLPPSRPENIGIKETEMILTTPTGDVRGCPAQDRFESLEDIRPNHSFYRLQAKPEGHEDVAELCTSSLNTTAELLQGCTDESDFCKAQAQGDPGTAEEAAPSLRRKRESAASHSPVQCPTMNLEQCSAHSESVNISNHRHDFVLSAEEDSKSSYCSSPAGGPFVTSEDPLQGDYKRIAAEIVGAADTEGQQTETVSSLFSASLDRVENISFDEELGFSTAKSLLEQVRGFLLPSFVHVPEDELEEGGKAAAIAEAALQLGRRRKLERRRHLATALEDAFGMKQAVQRMRAVKCPVLFVAHCAVLISRRRRGREVRMCRNRTASRGENIATDSSSTTPSSSDSVASTPVCDSDVLETLHRMLGGGDSLLAKHSTARMLNANESVSVDTDSFCMRAQPTKREEECTSGVQSPNGGAVDIQQTALPGNRDKLRSIDEKQEPSRFSGANGQISFDDESAGTCQIISKRSRLHCSPRGGEENIGSANDRLTEDAIVDRSIGLLMAHGNSCSKHEVFKTFQLDAKFFSRVKGFVEICRKTEGRRQRLEQLAALRAPLRFSSEEELRGGLHGRTRTSRGSSQMRNGRKTAKNFISPTRRPQNVKSGSPAVRKGSVNTVRIPFELFLVPPPYRHREDALNRVYAKERLEEADETESLISDQSWLHKTLEVCAKKLNLLAAAERAV